MAHPRRLTVRDSGARTLGAGTGEGGFSLIELTIALAIMALVMLSLAYSLSQSMKVTSFSQERQTAAALASKVLEQIRALPFATVAAGMSASDIAAVQSSSSPDTDIVGSSVPYTFAPNDEQIVSGATTANPPAPLFPYRTGPQLVNGTDYTTATYITQPSSTICTGCDQATVIVSWTGAALASPTSNQVSVETILATPNTGCISSSTHPFAAPCQPFFYGEASSGAASISITSATGGQAGISDLLGNSLGLTSAQLNLFEDDSTLENEQVSQVSGEVQTNGVSLQTVGNNLLTGGGIDGSSQADNDPAIDSNMTGPTSVNQSGSTSLSQSTAGGNLLNLTTSNADSASLISTTDAGAPSLCDDLSSVAQATGQACGSESVTQSGTGSGALQTANATMSASLNLASPGIGAINLASVAPVAGYTPTQTFVGYYPAGTGTSADCTLASGDGCVHAGGSENVGTILLGGAPTLLTPLTGWGGYLVKLADYSASVVAESGGGAASPKATCSYTISYWNGSGYSTTPCGSTGNTITASYSPAASLVNGSLVSVSITGTFQTGSASTTTGGGMESAQVSPPLSGDIVYTVSVGALLIVNLDISVNLGTLLAQTNYQAAPSAG